MSDTAEYEVVDSMSHSITVEQRDTTELVLALENAELDNGFVGNVTAKALIDKRGDETRLDVAIRVSVPEANAEVLLEGDETTAVELADAPDEISISGDADVDLSDHAGNGVTLTIELLAKRFWE